MNSLHQLRDLTWAVNSCPLIDFENVESIAKRSKEDDKGDQSCLPRLDPAQVDPQDLAEFLSESVTHRVGRYFERLIVYWIQHVRQLEVVADSLPIREGNRTVGEIDLLFRDEQERLTHWEMAVKFYLQFDHASTVGSHLIGPNAADTFERKVERLFEHQLPRSRSCFPEVEIRQAFVKGRIFYHPNSAPPERLPIRLSHNHLRSLWIRSSELDLICDHPETHYRILRKPYWLSEETASTDDTDLLTRVTLIESLSSHFRDREHPILISRLAPACDGSEGARSEGARSQRPRSQRPRRGSSDLQERDRLFIVSDRWPECSA